MFKALIRFSKLYAFDWQNHPVNLRKQWNFDSTKATELLFFGRRQNGCIALVAQIRHYFAPTNKFLPLYEVEHKTLVGYDLVKTIVN